MTTENPILLLYNQLPPSQQRAVSIIQTFIDTYNSKDGTGLFSGVARYQYLEDRTKIAAVQSRTLLDFWSNLRQKLACPIPNKGDDYGITKMWMLPANEQHETINNLATRAAEIIMIARSLADHDKADRILANTPINPTSTIETPTEYKVEKKPRGRKKDAVTANAEPNPQFNDPLPENLL
jgi:hypothetical protein